MHEERSHQRPTLLVLASTYPRWRDDHEPGFVHELCKRLADRFKVIAVVPHAPGAAKRELLDGVEIIRYRYAPSRFETLINDGGVVTNLRRYRWKVLLVPAFVLVQAWRTWRLLSTRKVDAVHAHWLLPQGLIAALLTGFTSRMPPFLVTSHGADLFALRGRWLNALKRCVVRKAAAVTVVSEAMRIELIRMDSDPEKIKVQPMGVDLTGRFTPSAEVQRSHDEILFVGRLVEKKGLHHLIAAMPAILAKHPSAYLTVVGFGPEEAERKAQSQRLGLQSKVRFVGALSQQELPALYRRAAVFVAPFVQASTGDQEGLGLVAVEAAGCGCPVVVSDLPAVRDIFNETEARLVEPGSNEAISDAVIAMLDEGPAVEATAKVTKSLRERYDWSIVAGDYVRILHELANAH